MYSNVLYYNDQRTIKKFRGEAMEEIIEHFEKENVTEIFAYNALFEKGHLPELSSYVWKDIMKLAAYRQYNHCIPEDAPCYKTGRLKSGYGVESIMRMLSGARNYSEVHNALCDAEDELKIMQLLKLDIDRYPEI